MCAGHISSEVEKTSEPAWMAGFQVYGILGGGSCKSNAQPRVDDNDLTKKDCVVPCRYHPVNLESCPQTCYWLRFVPRDAIHLKQI